MYDTRCRLFALADIHFYVSISVNIFTYTPEIENRLIWFIFIITISILSYASLKLTENYENKNLRKISIFFYSVQALYAIVPFLLDIKFLNHGGL